MGPLDGNLITHDGRSLPGCQSLKSDEIDGVAYAFSRALCLAGLLLNRGLALQARTIEFLAVSFF